MMKTVISKIEKKENQSFLNLLNSTTEPSDDKDGRLCLVARFPISIFSTFVDLLFLHLRLM